ncbi:MAG: FMN-binding protein [Patescibacteria group bacterium]|nr:FMN-binding protein [Patescibacteria group bacterium]MDE1946217.1 FMN-binding protein [Patescibacteria group bacterium]
MKKIILSSVFILAVAGYVIYQNMTGQSGSAAVAANTPGTTPTSGQTSGQEVPNPLPASNPMPSSNMGMGMNANAGMYKNGTYTGSVEDAYFGNVQVAAIISGGKLADVQFLSYPNYGHSLSVSKMSMPILKSEAIKAQSAEVDTVSGATQMSDAFSQSLASALALAKN